MLGYSRDQTLVLFLGDLIHFHHFKYHLHGDTSRCEELPDGVLQPRAPSQISNWYVQFPTGYFHSVVK
jgi:hypothetical protein